MTLYEESFNLTLFAELIEQRKIVEQTLMQPRDEPRRSKKKTHYRNFKKEV